MKLFVCNRNNDKVYIDISASNRRHLAAIIGRDYFFIGRDIYYVDKVYAEAEGNDTVGGAAIGGIVGLLGGPTGLLIGGLLGGLIGRSRENDEEIRVNNFNNSRL